MLNIYIIKQWNELMVRNTIIICFKDNKKFKCTFEYYYISLLIYFKIDFTRHLIDL